MTTPSGNVTTHLAGEIRTRKFTDTRGAADVDDLLPVTLSGTCGRKPQNTPGTFTLRGEYIRRWGHGREPGGFGDEQRFDLEPPGDIGSLLLTCSVRF